MVLPMLAASLKAGRIRLTSGATCVILHCLRGIFTECDNKPLPFELKGKGVIVTGASIGLGNAVAGACLREGASVYLCARDAEAMETARAALAGEFGDSRVFAISADVSKPES